MSLALIALGANLGPRERTLDAALERLAATPAIRLMARSRWVATAPVGGPEGQPEFLNGAAIVETSLAPHALLERMLEIERELGRERHEWWGARTIDLDLLIYGDMVCRDERLELPHPRLICRRFALEPAAEVAPDWAHPRFGWTLRELFTQLVSAPPEFVVVGIEGQVDVHDFCRRLTATGLLAERVASGQLAIRVVSIAPERLIKSPLELVDEINVSRPKLIVMLARGESPQFESVVFQPFRAPALRVEVSDLERALAEVTAALDEMSR